MSDLTIKEIQFEKDIEEYLISKGGYTTRRRRKKILKLAKKRIGKNTR